MNSLIPTLLLADSRLPSGAYAHSAGLEPAVQAGLSLEKLPEYLATKIRTTVPLEAAAACLSHRACEKYGATQRTELASELEQIAHSVAARTPSAALRDASRSLARGLLRLGVSVQASPGLDILAAQPTFRPIAFGVVAHSLGASARETASALCYEELQSVCSAALKLLAVDPMQAPRWVLQHSGAVETVVEQALKITKATELPAPSNPWQEAWSEAHTHNTRRLFSA